MPLSEFLRMARGKKADASSGSENDLVELVWESGQILMQGQSSRVTRSPARNNLHLNTTRVRDARFGKFGGVESILNDMAPVVPSGQLDLGQDDEMVPWLSYPMDDSLGEDYVSDFLPEMSGVTGNGLSNRSSFLSVSVGNLPLGSGVSDIVSNNTCDNQDATIGSRAQGRDVVSGSLSMKMERQNIRPPTTSGSNFLNFSHFSRPANLMKANTDGSPASGSSAVGRMEIREKGPVKSTLERFNSTPKDVEFDGSSSVLPKVNSREPVVVNTPKGPTPPERMENLCQETSIKNDNLTKGAPDVERIVEPMVASSSVGSGNSADRVSCEQTHNSKRKFCDIDESDCRSDDVDTESLDTKKTNHVRGAKRGRAAEVHNLSERRRRDRINEKMRALQELIPNCNKADKASMLDEAIEYLKTLQLQVQIMSMGAGLCMPPMMFPTVMQHIHPAHFPPMGVGMAAGMGFGMGMMDMNGVSSVYPVPPMHVPHFRPHVSGIPNFQRVPGPPVFGHPVQGLENSVPRAPFVPLTGAPPVTSAMGMSASRDPVTEASCSMKDKSNQAAGEVLDRSTSVQDDKKGTDAAHTSTTTTDVSKKSGEHNK
ncbi:hypothetical protein ACS0TY_005462 [Phlomoides rotata]